jgi:hypothetical protein
VNLGQLDFVAFNLGLHIDAEEYGTTAININTNQLLNGGTGGRNRTCLALPFVTSRRYAKWYSMMIAQRQQLRRIDIRSYGPLLCFS